ncbi:hypothetical protein RSAG8_07773, partial [Rhizoctonia solani AG-8 WAC10335]
MRGFALACRMSLEALTRGSLISGSMPLLCCARAFSSVLSRCYHFSKLIVDPHTHPDKPVNLHVLFINLHVCMYLSRRYTVFRSSLFFVVVMADSKRDSLHQTG